MNAPNTTTPTPQPPAGSVFIPALGRDDLHWIVAPDGSIHATYWEHTDEGLYAATRKALEAYELATMRQMPWGSDDRLDWLMAAATDTGQSLDMLEERTRGWFAEGERIAA